MIEVYQVTLANYVHTACFDHVVRALRNAASNFPEASGTVCIGGHLWSGPAPDGWIIWNSEQVSPDNPWMKEGYIQNCKNHQVWDYSGTNIEAWSRHYGIHAELLPIAYDPAMTGVIAPCKAKLYKPSFYGCLNDRRKEILARFDNYTFSHGTYGRKLDRALSRTPCVTNLHYYDPAIFEVYRCAYLWANAVPVMSEEALDHDDYAHMRDLFLPLDDLVARAISRDYPSGEEQRRDYMRAPWMSEHLEELI